MHYSTPEGKQISSKKWADADPPLWSTISEGIAQLGCQIENQTLRQKPKLSRLLALPKLHEPFPEKYSNVTHIGYDNFWPIRNLASDFHNFCFSIEKEKKILSVDIYERLQSNKKWELFCPLKIGDIMKRNTIISRNWKPQAYLTMTKHKCLVWSMKKKKKKTLNYCLKTKGKKIVDYT